MHRCISRWRIPAVLPFAAAQHKQSKMCNFRDILIVNNGGRKLQETCRAVCIYEELAKWLAVQWASGWIGLAWVVLPCRGWLGGVAHAQDKLWGRRMRGSQPFRMCSREEQRAFIKCNQEMHVIRIRTHTSTQGGTLPASVCVCVFVYVCGSVIYGSTLCLKRISLKWKAPALPVPPCFSFLLFFPRSVCVLPSLFRFYFCPTGCFSACVLWSSIFPLI